jgi:acetyl esterase/lipase
MMRTRFVLATLFVVSFMPNTVDAQTQVDRNVVVGMYSGLALVMDVHRPTTPNGLGIIHIAGSGWSRPLGYDAPQLSQAQFNVWGRPLVERGYTVFSLNHRATPRFAFPSPLEDVQRAVRFIRHHAAEFGIDPDRIGAVGGSSGGHLVTLLGVLDGDGHAEDPDPVNRVSAKVQTVVARAAPTDLVRMANTSGGAGLALLMGAQHTDASDDPETVRYKNASPVTYVSSDDPPTLLVHGDADQTVLFEQAEIFTSALRSAGVQTHLVRIPGGGHGPSFPGAVNPPDYVGAMLSWLEQHLPKK